MDFVGSRVVEKYFGWRAIVTPILKALSIAVLDPWNKPRVLGHSIDYGREGLLPAKERYEADFWISHQTRARFEQDFWETVHIDLRMTDISDFLIAFAPTNIYSVGTVHEIITARNQLKPVLLISPPISYDFFPELKDLSAEQKKALKFYGLKENPQGLPSQWYGNIVGGHNMFDGFGWEHLDLKGDDFYERLIGDFIDSKPSPGENPKWEETRKWAAKCRALRKLKGGVLDHVVFQNDEEEALLKQALAAPVERERHFFWYNHSYQPKRAFLSHLLSIASGHIPPKTTIISEYDEHGGVRQRPLQSIDDNWLLLGADNL
jgi:hypothetical protein